MIALAVIFGIAVVCWWFAGRLMGPPMLVSIATCKACREKKQVDSNGYCRSCWNSNFGAFL